ncbi:MAG TPA: ArsR family transcriptional regulator [Thermoplasmata archaeon]|nr:ArsR family transcriptional regulator [Thermoplasmata archaeon]
MDGGVRQDAFVAILVMMAITGLVVGTVSAITINLDRKETVWEGETAVFDFEVINDEATRIRVTLTWKETEFGSEVEPREIQLYPSQRRSGYYRVGPCDGIDGNLTMRLFLNFSVERLEPMYSDTYHNATLNLTVLESDGVAKPEATGNGYSIAVLPVVAAGAGLAGLLYVYWKRSTILGALVPLYHRVDFDDMLNHEKRGEIHDLLIRSGTGMPLNDISAMTGIDRNTARYHLSRLIDTGIVYKGTDRRYYHWKNVRPDCQSLEEAVRQMCLNNPNMRQADIARSLGTSRQRVNYHIRKMKEKGDL